MHWMPWALIFAPLNAGNNIAARIAMIAITTSSSISVKPGFEPYQQWRCLRCAKRTEAVDWLFMFPDLLDQA